MAMQYDYDSDHSQRAMARIITVLTRREGSGATQSQIAKGSGMTTPTVSRYLKHLIEQQDAHEAGKTKSPRGGKAVVYKPGPNPNPPPPRNRRFDPWQLPLAFFGVRKMNINQQQLSPYFAGQDYRPMAVGPYQCRTSVDFRDGKTEAQTIHFRWWDGKNWSHPLDFDPAFDDQIVPPPADEMIHAGTEAELIADYLVRFDWRGYNSDQEEL